MKQEKTGSRRSIHIIAAVAAFLILAGGTAGAFALRSNAGEQTESSQEGGSVRAAAANDGTISAGGTIASAQRSDDLGLVNTSVRLTVEAVLAEAGDTVKAGTALYQITEDSLTKAEKTLRSELQSAESDLLKQKMTYQEDKNEAALLYESEQALGSSAQQEYETALAELDSALQAAYDAYAEADNTVSTLPAEITAKEKELKTKQNTAETRKKEQESAQKSLSSAEQDYRAAAERYNSLTAEYNAAAGAVLYLGKALGKDVSGVSLVQNVEAETQTQSSTESAERTAPESGGKQNFSGGTERPAEFSGMNLPADGEGFSGGIQRRPQPDAGAADGMTAPEQREADSSAALYESAKQEYEAQKKLLTEAETAYKKAETKYNSCTEALRKAESAVREAESGVSALEQEISALNSTLSKASSSLSKLRAEYNSLKASYDSDQLELKHTLDTDTASGNHAQYHYEITCATIEDALAEKQEAYDTAEENLRIFVEKLADGCICAEQDGTVYSLSCQEGRSVNLNTPFVYYVDETSYYTTVELDQNDVTQVSIGDSVLIYSSETGIANGKVTAIAAGTSTSLADVRFNVTVTADENASLYSGESVNVYFNTGNLKQSDFRDFSGGDGSSERTKPSSDGERPDFSGGMPDFGGNMPEGFDPSNLPDFGSRRKGE